VRHIRKSYSFSKQNFSFFSLPYFIPNRNLRRKRSRKPAPQNITCLPARNPTIIILAQIHRHIHALPLTVYLVTLSQPLNKTSVYVYTSDITTLVHCARKAKPNWRNVALHLPHGRSAVVRRRRAGDARRGFGWRRRGRGGGSNELVSSAGWWRTRCWGQAAGRRKGLTLLRTLRRWWSLGLGSRVGKLKLYGINLTRNS